MADAILTDNDRKADPSFACLAALDAKAGYTCQRGPQPDVDSIDATIRSGDPMRTGFDVQLKATSSPKRHEDGLHFSLSKKNYNDLGAARMVPLILLVLELPSDEADWVECTVEKLTMRRCGWWESLSGSEPTDAGSKTIVIPSTQRLGPRGIAPILTVGSPSRRSSTGRSCRSRRTSASPSTTGLPMLTPDD